MGNCCASHQASTDSRVYKDATVEFVIHTDEDKDITFSSNSKCKILRLKNDITQLYQYENFDLYLSNEILQENKTIGE